MAKNPIFRVFNPDSCIPRKMPSEIPGTILFAKPMQGCAWSLQPFNQNYDLASHILYGVCVNFIYEWLNLQRQIFEKLYRGNFIYILRVFANNLLGESRRIQMFFVFRFVGNI